MARSSLYAGRGVKVDTSAWWVKHDVCQEQQINYSVAVMKIYEHENQLNTGRFENFTHESQAWSVSIYHENKIEPWWKRAETLVEWVAENVDSPWSLDIKMEHVSAGHFIFTFADMSAATFFKMMFV